jgi:hypothetical protein
MPAGGARPGVAAGSAQSWTLNEAQTEVLRWIADGCPDGVLEGYEHRISAAALRTRDSVPVPQMHPAGGR